VFLGLQDPDPLVRGMDPDPALDPDPSFAEKICRQSTKFFEGVLKALRATLLKSSSLAEGQPEKNHWSKEIWPPSSPDCNPFDSSMWCEFEREANKKSHNTLASLWAKILEVMANMDREFVIHSYKKFWSRIEAVVDFIVLNVTVEFVLIYRPHPVL
jgi:hypothetical protein